MYFAKRFDGTVVLAHCCPAALVRAAGHGG